MVSNRTVRLRVRVCCKWRMSFNSSWYYMNKCGGICQTKRRNYIIIIVNLICYFFYFGSIQKDEMFRSTRNTERTKAQKLQIIHSIQPIKWNSCLILVLQHYISGNRKASENVADCGATTAMGHQQHDLRLTATQRQKRRRNRFRGRKRKYVFFWNIFRHKSIALKLLGKKAIPKYIYMRQSWSSSAFSN